MPGSCAGVDNLASRCEPFATAGVVYYSVVVPAGERLTVTATVTSGWWGPAVRLLSSCGATSCLASRSGAWLSESVTHDNTTTAAENLVIAVSRVPDSGPGLFDLDVTIAPP